MAVIKVPILKAGDQIVYLPDHADGDMNHSAAELGFVERVRNREGVPPEALCRFWRRGHPGELRTVANGEWCGTYSLALYDSVPQDQVDSFFADQEGDEPPGW